MMTITTMMMTIQMMRVRGGVQSRAQVALMFKVSLIFIFLFFLHLSLFCVSSSLSPVLYNFVSKAAHASS